MHMRKLAPALACAATCVLAASARADEAREQALEERVHELEKRLTEVTEGLRGGYFTANSDLEARISELETAYAQDKGGMASVFKSGLRHESSDKSFSYQFYGRLQNDWFWFDDPGEYEDFLGTDLNGGTGFRRVRLGASGTLYGNVKFKSEIDFAGGAVEFADVFAELTNCFFGAVRVGHFDEPFGLDRLTSSRFITFTERNLIEQAGFTPGRNTGIMVHGTAAEDKLVYQFGMFRDADGAGNDVGNAKKGEYNLTGRVAGRPFVAEDGSTFLHLGAAYSLRDFSNDEVRFRARPQVPFVARFVDTGTLSGITDGNLLGLEAMFATGPFMVKGEWARASGDGDGVDDFDFDAFGLEASVWLTGETTAYDRSVGRVDRPKILKNFGDGDGMGGLQLAVGYDQIDLNDASYAGGEMDTLRFGVNWWLNPNTRVTLNVVHIDRDEADDTTNALVMRFQVDF